MNKPWLDAQPGEVWVLSQGDETITWVAQEHGYWKSADGKWWLLEQEDIDAITAGYKKDEA